MLTAAACTIDSTIPNVITQEFSTIDESPVNNMIKTSWKRNGGYIEVSEKIGLGIEVEFDKLKKQNFETRLDIKIPMRDDGSVGYSV